jgi:Mrp family chromosome partitioning ATPase
MHALADEPEAERPQGSKPDDLETSTPGPERRLSLSEELLAFLDQLELRVPERPAAVQLIGARGGEGTTTLARELARCAVSRGTAALLVQIPQPESAPDTVAPAAPPRHEAVELSDLTQLEAGILGLSRSRPRGRPAELVLGPEAVVALRDSKPERERFVQVLKESFDLVLVDAPPALAGNDGVLLATSADAVVLVVEAEVTRRPVAQAAVERIRDSGATLVGLLFNKRRHHIPDAVYRLL